MRFFMTLLAVLALSWTQPSQAQTSQWREQSTAYIAILYPEGSEAVAAQYAAIVDPLYEEVTSAVGYRPEPPLTLRIYPTMEIYRQVNPLAQVLTGVVAHAHTGRREISIALPQLEGRSDEEVANVVRHELMHVIAAELSEGQLSTMWQEGIAQYIETPTDQAAQKSGYLSVALERNQLLSWAQLDAPGVMYSSPSLGYPQSWSMVAFLVERNGMPDFVRFMRAQATSSGYRSALQSVYGTSPDTLEAEWRSQLEAWIAGGWQSTAPIIGTDVASLERAVAAGQYAAAIPQLEEAIAATNDPATRATLQELLTQAQRGNEAQEQAAIAQTAILAGDYTAASPALERARILYNSLGRTDVLPTLEIYAARIADGQRAYALLATAGDGTPLGLGGEQAILDAAAIFAAQGDTRGLAAAQAALDARAQRATKLAIALIGLVILGMAWNIDRRRSLRRRSLPIG